MSGKTNKRLRKFGKKMALLSQKPVNLKAVKENYKKLNIHQKERVMKDVRKALDIKPQNQ